MPLTRPRWRLKRTDARFHIDSSEARRLRADRMREFGVRRAIYLVFVPILFLMILLVAWLKMPILSAAHYRPIESPFANPGIGWATCADDFTGAPLSTLVYVEATWRELEPEMGQFDFDSFEQRNHLPHWRAAGRRMILRIVADQPGEAGHMDIPDWLYEWIGGSGSFYQTPAGGGFSPDYVHPGLRERHRALIDAVGAQYNDDPFLAYIEIGSLGHNGLWQIDRQQPIDPLPLPNITRGYVWHYNNALNRTLMLMTHPYREVRTLMLGVFHPHLGDEDATWAHLNAIDHGGYDDQVAADLYAVPRFWTYAPAAAHLSAGVDLESLLIDRSDVLARQLQEGHLSYVAIDRPLDSLSPAALEAMERATLSMGYRFWVRSARWSDQIRRGYRATVELTLRNDGVAPLYGDWQAALALKSGDQVALVERQPLSVIDIQPGERQFRASIDIPADFEAGVYQLSLAIVDRATGQPAVRFAMDECGEDLWVALGEIEVTP